MLYSRAAEYAIRALGHLATVPDGQAKMARAVAEEEGLPVYFLAKTLQTLAREGIVKSLKGPRGGFLLRSDAGRVRLVDVITAIDGDQALIGDHAYLPGFRRVKSDLMAYLKTTTVRDVANNMSRRRKAQARGKKTKRR